MADETPLPMPLLVVCRTIMTNGNASEAPASASDPSRPRKKPSNVIMPANASRLRMLGADSRSSVGTIGPSSSSLVRAAPDCCAGLADAKIDDAIVGAGDDEEVGRLRSFTRRSSPRRVWEQLLDET